MLLTLLIHHAYGTLPEFGGILGLCLHNGSILSKVGASSKPRAVHIKAEAKIEQFVFKIGIDLIIG